MLVVFGVMFYNTILNSRTSEEMKLEIKSAVKYFEINMDYLIHLLSEILRTSCVSIYGSINNIFIIVTGFEIFVFELWWQFINIILVQMKSFLYIMYRI